MLWIIEESVLKCDHGGRITNKASQDWVTVQGVPALVDHDPEGRSITACPNFGPTIKPCAKTLNVVAGYSAHVRIGDRRLVMSDLDGLTDGTPPLSVHYRVRDPRQQFVRVDR